MKEIIIKQAKQKGFIKGALLSSSRKHKVEMCLIRNEVYIFNNDELLLDGNIIWTAEKGFFRKIINGYVKSHDNFYIFKPIDKYSKTKYFYITLTNKLEERYIEYNTKKHIGKERTFKYKVNAIKYQLNKYNTN